MNFRFLGWYLMLFVATMISSTIYAMDPVSASVVAGGASAACGCCAACCTPAASIAGECLAKKLASELIDRNIADLRKHYPNYYNYFMALCKQPLVEGSPIVEKDPIKVAFFASYHFMTDAGVLNLDVKNRALVLTFTDDLSTSVEKPHVLNLGVSSVPGKPDVCAQPCVVKGIKHVLKVLKTCNCQTYGRLLRKCRGIKTAFAPEEVDLLRECGLLDVHGNVMSDIVRYVTGHLTSSTKEPSSKRSSEGGVEDNEKYADVCDVKDAITRGLIEPMSPFKDLPGTVPY